MPRRLKLGPKAHGKSLAYHAFMAAEYKPGYKYEIIDGRLYVSSKPDLPENRVDQWLFMKVSRYMLANLQALNYVSNKARIFVPDRSGITVPEPDLAAYRDYPFDLPIKEVRWEELRPVLVAEIMAGEDTDKDSIRNVELYFQVPSIKEYWLFDARDDPERPTLTVHRRYGGRWVIREYAFGDVYTTRLLPGFTLKVDPRSR